MKEPITYSNEWFKGKQLYVIAGIFALLAIGSISVGIYMASIAGDWWVMFLFIPVAAIFIFFAYIFYPTEQEHLYRYELTDEGLYQQWKNKVTKKDIEKFIPFDEVSHVLIGIYANRISMPRTRSFYRYEALLIIVHHDDYFFERFLSVDDLHNWVTHLKDKVPSIRYTSDDLSEAYDAQYYTVVDFSQIEGMKKDTVTARVGIETYTKRLTVWRPAGMVEEINKAQKKSIRPQTKNVEMRTFWIIFFYNFLFAAFILPSTPLDEDNFIEMTTMILVAYFVVNLLIPTILVFWRKFTKWYGTFLFTFANLVGQFIGFISIYLFTDIPFIYESILLLNAFMLVLLIVAHVSIQLFKRVANFINKHNLS